MLQQDSYIKEYIWNSLSNLPKDSLNEILNFVIYTQKKVSQPDLFQFSYDNHNTDLSRKSKKEIEHLEDEFYDYKKKYPHE